MTEAGCDTTLAVSPTGIHEAGEQPERPVESALSQLREALSFLGPFLSDFNLKPIQVMAYMKEHPEPTRRRAMINHEKKGDNQAAVDEFIDWLLHTPIPGCLSDFLQALQHATDEHRRVYCLLALCGVYLPVHQQLVTVLGQKLQEDVLVLSPLLTHLTQHGLLSAQQKTNVVAEFLNWLHWLKKKEGSGSQQNSEEGSKQAELGGSEQDLEQGQDLELGGSEPDLEQGQDLELGGSEQTSAKQIQVSEQDLEEVQDVQRGSDETVQTCRAEDSDQRAHLPREEAATQLERPQGGQYSAQSEQPLSGHNSEQTEAQDTRPATPDSVVKYLLASLYYKQTEILLSQPPASSTTTPSCDRCNYEAGEGMLGCADCPWTDYLVHVLDCQQSLLGVSACTPDRETYRRLWSRSKELLGPFVVQPPEVTSQNDATGGAAADGGQEITDAPGSDAGESTGSDSDSDRTVVPSSYALAFEKYKRTEEYVKVHSKAVRLPRDDDCDSTFSKNTTMSSDSNPPTATPIVPRTEGVLQKDEMMQLKTGVIDLRPFQEELLAPARKGHNVMIWVPTGTGKTYMVLKYAQEHLESCTAGRVAFVVPTVRLATQQHARFEFFLPQFKPHLRTGETSGTNNSRIPWAQLLDESRIFVLTAECLVKAVEQKHVCLSSFTLLVLDECHHTRGGHPLRNLMNQYMDLKFSKSAGSVTLPQIIGLTASPGVGRARGESEEKALVYLRELCSRLDVREICSVRQHKADLEQYVHEPKHEIRVSDKRNKDKFKKQLEKFMEYVEQHMCTHVDVERYIQMDPEGRERLQRDLGPPVSHRGENQYTEWAHGLEKKLTEVKSKSAFYVLMACTEMLKLLQRALILNEDCRSDDALNFLKKEIARRRAETPDTAHVDLHLYDEFNKKVPKLEAYCKRKSSQNPKLRLLREIILTCTSVQDNQKHSLDDEDTSTNSLNIPLPAPQEPNRACSDWVRESVELSGTGLRQPDGQTAVQKGTDVQEVAKCLRGMCDDDSRHLNDGTREDPNMGAAADSASSSDSELEILDCGQDWVLDSSVRGMIFVRTLDLSKALVEFMRDDPQLCELNPARITGVNASVNDGGMTKSEVTEVMGNFNSGQHRIVVCTSAAEEGLDFRACNLVIRYDYVTSMVSMIQTRGRARQEDSRYCVMGHLTSASIAKERANQASEKLMCTALSKLQQEMDSDPGAHLDNIARRQQQAYTKRWNPEMAEARRQSQKLPGGYYRLLCSKCLLPACKSTHIRLLKKTNRVVIGAAFSRRYTRQEAKGKTYDKDIPTTGHALHCIRCGHKWGIFVRSMDDGTEFPVITIKSFLVQNEKNELMIVDKWSKAFDVPHLSDEDRAVQVRMSQPSAEGGDAGEESERDEDEILGQAGEDSQQVPPEGRDSKLNNQTAGLGDEKGALVPPAAGGNQQASSAEPDTNCHTASPKEVDGNALSASSCLRSTPPGALALNASICNEKVSRQAKTGRKKSSSGKAEKECPSAFPGLKTTPPGPLAVNTTGRDGKVLRQAEESRPHIAEGIPANCGRRGPEELAQRGEGKRAFCSTSSRLKPSSSRRKGVKASVGAEKGLRQPEKTDSGRQPEKTDSGSKKTESQKPSTSMKKKTPTRSALCQDTFDLFDDDVPSYTLDAFDDVYDFNDGPSYDDDLYDFNDGPSYDDDLYDDYF